MKFITLLLFILISLSCSNNNYITEISSPDKKIKLKFELINGKPSYSVKKLKETIISNSSLGLILKDNIDLTKDFYFSDIKKSNFNESWVPLMGEFKTIENNYNKLEVTLSQNNKKISIEFKLFNDGIGFRYLVPNQDSIKNYDLIDEKTQFNISKNDSAWWQPAFSYRRYEFLYANTKVDEISKSKFSELIEDLSYDTLGIDAAQTPLTIKKENGFFIS